LFKMKGPACFQRPAGLLCTVWSGGCSKKREKKK
jgi:hypothetical protein